MRDGVARYPDVEVRPGHEVVDVLQDDAGVTVRAVDARTGRATTATGRFVLGCDGARSTVRKAGGIASDDYGFDRPWLVVDVVLRRPVDPPDVCQQVCDPSRPMTFVPLTGMRRRFEFMLLAGESAVAMQEPGAVRALLSRWIDPDDADIVRAAVYTFHALVARRWRLGRAFLVGEAAHQMPPFLGQGMCAGVRDAANLAWKLVAVLRGQASETLLDTYQTEREPHVRAITDLAVSLGSIIQTTDHNVASLRDSQFLAAPPAADLSAPALPRLGPGARHGEHPLVATQVPQPRVLRDGTAVRLDDALADGWVLLDGDRAGNLLDDGRQRRLDARGIRPLRVVGVGSSHGGVVDGDLVDTEGALRTWLEDAGAVAAVIRPDRYVFAVIAGGDSGDAAVDAAHDAMDRSLLPGGLLTSG